MKRTFVCRAGAALAMAAMLVLLAPRAEAARPPGVVLRDAGQAAALNPAALFGRAWGWLSSLWGPAEGTDSYGGGQTSPGDSGEGGQGAAPSGTSSEDGAGGEIGHGIDPNG